ncbi:MAG: hypothetical protein RB191_12525 [Terriglobia bacterium]|nr:hypothetical protein [Terriglobia bacterium]
MYPYLDIVLAILLALEYILMIGLNVGDVATTDQFLKEKKDTEANWMMSQLQNYFGWSGPWWFPKVIAAVGAAAGLYAWYLFDFVNVPHGSNFARGAAIVFLVIFALVDYSYYQTVLSNKKVDQLPKPPAS